MAIDSRAATIIAADPPYSRKVKNTAASEKLIANRERGSVRLIRGPTIVENASTNKKPKLNASRGRVASDKTMHTKPIEITIPFVRSEWVALFIKRRTDGRSGGHT